MMLKRNKNIPSYKKAIYIYIVVIIILLAVLLSKVIRTEKSYDQSIYDEVYKEFNEIMAEISIENEMDEEARAELQARFDQARINNYNKKGRNIRVIGRVSISKIKLNLPIISQTSYDNLKVGPTKFYGCNPNQVGNLCIVGHNYRDGTHFSNLDKLEKEDSVEISSSNGKTESYVVYDKYIVDPNDLRCTSQNTNGGKEVTLITCTDDSKSRLIVKCKQM